MNKSVHMYVHPFMLAEVATQSFREKKQQQSQLFLLLNFDVYTDFNNRERARAGGFKKQQRRRNASATSLMEVGSFFLERRSKQLF